MGALLAVRDLVTTVRVGDIDVAAVSGVSFQLQAGRTLGLVGESGCGKSLTAMSIVRLLAAPHVRIAGGEVTFDGRDLSRLPERELRGVRGRRIGMVFQEPSTALNPVMTAGDQVAEPLRVHDGLGRRAARARAVELLAEVGIPSPAERARAYPHELSGGMKQRVMIAMALACRPGLLIADEPTTALDVTVQAQILDLLARLRRERGMALLLITHDLGVVAETCDDVAVMYAGRIVESAPAPVLFATPRHPYTVGLLTALRTLEHGGEGDSEQGGGARRRLREIPGAVPALGQAPAGCAFADRCSRAATDCRTSTPPLAPAGAPDHLVRCFHPEPLA